MRLFNGVGGNGSGHKATPGNVSKISFRQEARLLYDSQLSLFVGASDLGGGIVGVYFLAAYAYLWKKAGVNMWRVWWQTTGNLKTERRFAVEIRRFPRWHLGYQTVKWGTLPVVIGYITSIFIYVSHR
jgi:hypothetical protein